MDRPTACIGCLRTPAPTLLLVAALGPALERLPISNARRRLARTLLRASPPVDTSARELHRYLVRTEPWALEALTYLGAEALAPAVRVARETRPAEPLLRGDELGSAARAR